MYKVNRIKMVNSCIVRIPKDKGESLEEMLRRCTANSEPIEATAPMIYTEESTGVQAECDPRTDRFELALDAIDKYQKSEIASGTNTTKEERTKEQDNAPTPAYNEK